MGPWTLSQQHRGLSANYLVFGPTLGLQQILSGAGQPCTGVGTATGDYKVSGAGTEACCLAVGTGRRRDVLLVTLQDGGCHTWAAVKSSCARRWQLLGERARGHYKCELLEG